MPRCCTSQWSGVLFCGVVDDLPSKICPFYKFYVYFNRLLFQILWVLNVQLQASTFIVLNLFYVSIRSNILSVNYKGVTQQYLTIASLRLPSSLLQQFEFTLIRRGCVKSQRQTNVFIQNSTNPELLTVCVFYYSGQEGNVTQLLINNYLRKNSPPLILVFVNNIIKTKCSISKII